MRHLCGDNPFGREALPWVATTAAVAVGWGLAALAIPVIRGPAIVLALTANACFLNTMRLAKEAFDHSQVPAERAKYFDGRIRSQTLCTFIVTYPVWLPLTVKPEVRAIR